MKFMKTSLFFILWCIIVIILSIFHEPWRDELQAFLIARDLSFGEIFSYLKYEGHFVPWLYLIKCMTLLGLPVGILKVLSLILVISAGLLLLKFSPFSKRTKVIILFSAPMIFWYPVVSRCYALIPVILFMIATIYRNRCNHPYIYGFLIALLANTHAYMEGLVLALFLDIIWDAIQERRDGICKTWTPRLIPALIILAGVGFAFATVYGAFAYSDTCQNMNFPSAAAVVNKTWHVVWNWAGCQVSAGGKPFIVFGLYAVSLAFICFTIRSAEKIRKIIYFSVLGIFSVILIVKGSFGTLLLFLFLCTIFFTLPILKGKSSIFFYGLLALGIGWQFFMAIFIYGFLPERAFLGLIIIIFSAWITVEKNKNMLPEKQQHFKLEFDHWVLLYVFITSFRLLYVVLKDLLYPYSGYTDCAEFLRMNAPSEKLCCFSLKEPSPTGFTAFLGGKMFVIDKGNEYTFYPRNKNHIQTMIQTEEKQISFTPHVFVEILDEDSVNDFSFQGRTFRKVYETSFIPYWHDERFCVYFSEELIQQNNKKSSLPY